MTIVKGMVSQDIEKSFRKRAMEKYGYSRGSVSKALEEALKVWVEAEADENTDEKRNNEAYEKMRAELEVKYRGKYICIAHGRIVATGRSLREIYEATEKPTRNTSHKLIFKVGEEISKEERLGWRVKRIVGHTNRETQLISP